MIICASKANPGKPGKDHDGDGDDKEQSDDEDVEEDDKKSGKTDDSSSTSSSSSSNTNSSSSSSDDDDDKEEAIADVLELLGLESDGEGHAGDGVAGGVGGGDAAAGVDCDDDEAHLPHGAADAEIVLPGLGRIA